MYFPPDAVDMEVMGNSIIDEDIFNLGAYGNEVIVTSYDEINTEVIAASATSNGDRFDLDKYSNHERIDKMEESKEVISTETVSNSYHNVSEKNMPQNLGWNFQSERVETNQVMDVTYDVIEKNLLLEREVGEENVIYVIAESPIGNLNSINNVDTKTKTGRKRGRPKGSKNRKPKQVSGCIIQNEHIKADRDQVLDINNVIEKNGIIDYESGENVGNVVAESPIGNLNSIYTVDIKTNASRRCGQSDGTKNYNPKPDKDMKLTRSKPNDSSVPVNVRKSGKIDLPIESIASEQRNKTRQLQQREKMNESTKALKALIPGIGCNTDKGTVIEITANYVKFLKSKISEEYDSEFLTQMPI